MPLLKAILFWRETERNLTPPAINMFHPGSSSIVTPLAMFPGAFIKVYVVGGEEGMATEYSANSMLPSSLPCHPSSSSFSFDVNFLFVGFFLTGAEALWDGRLFFLWVVGGGIDGPRGSVDGPDWGVNSGGCETPRACCLAALVFDNLDGPGTPVMGGW